VGHTVNLDQLKDHLRQSEGFRSRPYLDTEGFWTIGFGSLLPRNITRQELNAMRWTREHAETVLDKDIANAIHEAGAFPWWMTMDSVRQAAVVELLFNLGRSKFKKFQKMIEALQNRAYQKAARELLWNTHADGTRTPTRWREQVGPTRSRRLAKMLETGRVE
jgi:GH24 family phage-related lysozyme (muramidase)